jgi:hypothetical protein
MRRADGRLKRPQRPTSKTGVALRLHLTDAKRAVFLKELAAHGVAREAARVAGVPVSTLFHARKRDPAFAAEWRDAVEEADAGLEREAVRRAVEGVRRYEIAKGAVVRDPETGGPLEFTTYSDKLLELLLRSRVARFRERREVDVRHSMAADSIAYLSTTDIACLDRGERRTLYGILRKVADARRLRAEDAGEPIDAEFFSVDEQPDALPPPDSDPDDLKEICS